MVLAFGGARRRLPAVHPVRDAGGPPWCPALWAAPTYTSSSPVSRLRSFTRLPVTRSGGGTSGDLSGAPLLPQVLTPRLDTPALPLLAAPIWALPGTHSVGGAHVGASVLAPVGGALFIRPF